MTSLEIVKTKARQYVDNVAEASRQHLITPGAGQIATYQEKAEQAIDFAAAGYPANLVGNYPFIAAEVEALQKTPQQATDDILAARTAWILAGSAIEKIRLMGKNSIDAAATEAEVRQVRQATFQALKDLVDLGGAPV